MVGIVIINYNNAKLTLNCIESVLCYNTYPIKILVVDNASTDGSVEELIKDGQFKYLREINETTKLPTLSLIESAENCGYARGNNMGLLLMEKDEEIEYEMILNNDILFIEDIIPHLVKFLNEHREAGLVSPLLLGKDGVSVDTNCARKDAYLREIFSFYMLYTKNYFGLSMHYRNKRKILLQHPEKIHSDILPIELPSGACMIIRKSLFKEMDYFDPYTFLYYEENILYRKALKLNKINYLLPKLKCIHLGCQTAKKVVRTSEYIYACNKSAIYYALNYRTLKKSVEFFLKMSYRVYLLFFNIRHKTSYRCFWEDATSPLNS